MNDRDLQTQLDAYLSRFSTFPAPTRRSRIPEKRGRTQALRSDRKVLSRLAGVAGIVVLAAGIVLFATELNAHRVSTSHTVSPPSPVWSPSPLRSPNPRLRLPRLPASPLLPVSARILVPETQGMGRASVTIVPEGELFIQYACVSAFADSVVVSSTNPSNLPLGDRTGCASSAAAAFVEDTNLPEYPNEVVKEGDLGKPLTLTIWTGPATTWEIFIAESGPPVPPNGTEGLIAVAANPWDVEGGENADIYLLSGGASPRRLIGSDGDGIAQQCPAFSPDGQRLAYGEARASGAVTSQRGKWPVSDRTVVVVKLSDPSKPLLRVTLPTGPGEIACPEWSPDGRDLAFRVGTALWVADSTSGKTTVFQVGETPFGEQAFAWSRDGSRIAVAEPGQIRVIPIHGGAPAVISVTGDVPGSYTGSMGWTAGDDAIVYTTTDPQGDALAVFRVGADGTGDTQLAGGSDSAVSPDGTRVAFIDGDGVHVLTMNTRGGDVVEVPVAPDVLLGALLWSPDGKSLLLSSIDGVVSVPAAPGSTSAAYASGQLSYPGGGLNLEWSASEVTWQPVAGGPTK